MATTRRMTGRIRDPQAPLAATAMTTEAMMTRGRGTTTRTTMMIRTMTTMKGTEGAAAAATAETRTTRMMTTDATTGMMVTTAMEMGSVPAPAAGGTMTTRKTVMTTRVMTTMRVVSVARRMTTTRTKTMTTKTPGSPRSTAASRPACGTTRNVRLSPPNVTSLQTC